MKYTKISPLGPRMGPGTFDTLFDVRKYATLEEATEANDYVIVDFVKDPENVIYFEAYHSRKPEEKTREPLDIQHFPAGIDSMDDHKAVMMGEALLEENS